MNEQEDSSPELDEETAHKLLHFLRNAPNSRSLSDVGCDAPQIARSLGDACPNEETYMKLALGSIQGETADAPLTHAATCDRCGQTLLLHLQAIDGTPSPEELAAIAEMPAMQAHWQDELVQKLASTRHRQRPFGMRTSIGWITGFGAIAALVFSAVALFIWQRSLRAPAHQLAAAYSDDRTLELRIPGAGWTKYSPPDHRRGGITDEEPPALLDARARLARDLEKSPQNPRLLELQARANVLNQKYDTAVDVLDRLIASGPVTPELLTDAASAYFERGLTTGSELDRSTALDYVRRADEMAPTDPVILFNEGIVMEDRGQVMNAVEVWNRYLTVEHDAKWAAEGKRRLEALEQTLNRLKSHQSRIDHMLATPASMDALAANTPKLAALDEELATYELDKLLLAAYPMAGDSAANPQASRPAARASPCDDRCQAARRLLKALGHSLKIQHQDPWLSNLIRPSLNSLSTTEQAAYSQALNTFAHALSKNLLFHSVEGEGSAAQAALLFHKIRRGANGEDRALQQAASVGELRSSLEQMLSMQFETDFVRCRSFARSHDALWQEDPQYPWIHVVKMVTDVVCDSTPELRLKSQELADSALMLAESSHYPFLISRIHMRMADKAFDAGDMDLAERIALNELKILESRDTPGFRLLGTLDFFAYVAGESLYPRATELFHEELLDWQEANGEHMLGAVGRLDIARLLMRTGRMAGAEQQIHLGYEEIQQYGTQNAKTNPMSDVETQLASFLLERHDLTDAQTYLQRAAAHRGDTSEPWGLRLFAETSGQLRLEQEDYAQAAKYLEGEIHRNEDRNKVDESSVAQAEFAEQDHDLYAELVATWLAQGRPAEDVLTLWERFRMRSRALPVIPCPGELLRCGSSQLVAALHRLDGNVLVGQIILLDRVLTYRADRNGVTWKEEYLQRQDVLASEQRFERAVSSPGASMQTVKVLGTQLRNSLLPETLLPPDSDSVLLVESDPLFHNLAWPALPTSGGPLGLVAPMAQVRSILAIKEAGPSRSMFDEAAAFNDEGKRALIIGASTPAIEEVPLPEAIEEAQSVELLLNAPVPLLGARATNSNIAAHIDSATILHFAGHALQRTDGTELLLAQSSTRDQSPWIDGKFFREHPPRVCRLAVLSTCSSGNVVAAWSHPSQDLVETLASSGVNDVVATRWEVDSQASVSFMNAFYTSMDRGNSAPLALLSARRVLSANPHFQNPYYWAAYSVTSAQILNPHGEFNVHQPAQKESEEEHSQ